MGDNLITLILAAGPALPSGYNPDDAHENLLEYIGVAIAFILSGLVIWLIIRKDLKNASSPKDQRSGTDKRADR